MADIESLVLEGVRTAFAQRRKSKGDEDLAWLFLHDHADTLDGRAEDHIVLIDDMRMDHRGFEPRLPRKSKKLVKPHPQEEVKFRLPNIFASPVPFDSPQCKVELWTSPVGQQPSPHALGTRERELESYLFSEAETPFLELESRCGIPLNQSHGQVSPPRTPLLSLQKVEKLMLHHFREFRGQKDKKTSQTPHRRAEESIAGSERASARAQQSHDALVRAVPGAHHRVLDVQQGPPSRHVSTRAKSISVQARREAEEKQRHPPTNQGCRVADAEGNVHKLPGVKVGATGSRRLTKVEPFPIFSHTAEDPPEEPKERKPLGEERYAIKPSDLMWDCDKELDGEVQEIMTRSVTSTLEAADFKAENVEAPRSRSVNDLTRKPKREVVFRPAALVSAGLNWGKGSSTNRRLDMLRNSEDERERLRRYVTKELPHLKRHGSKHAVNFLKQNIGEAREGEFIRRASSGNSQLTPSIVRRQRRRSSIDFTRTSSGSGVEDKLPLVPVEKPGPVLPPPLRTTTTLTLKDYQKTVLVALMVERYSRKLFNQFKLERRRKMQEVAASFRAILFVQRWYRKVVTEKAVVKVLDEVKVSSHGNNSPQLTKGLVMKCQMNVRVMHKRGTVAVLVAFLRDLRVQSDVKIAVKRYRTAVVRVQTCIRTFLAVRRVRWMVWEMQWVTYEKKKNRELMRIWRRQWQQTTQEISRILKLKPGNDKLKNKKVNPGTVRWVSSVMDDFIHNLPPEVKNIMDVPEDIRHEILMLHKVAIIQAHLAHVESHRRRKVQVTENRKFRDILFVTFPKLSEMDLKDPELQFLVDCSVDPLPPFLTPVLNRETLEAMIERGKNIARGLEPRRVFVGKGVTRTAPRQLPAMQEVEHRDSFMGDAKLQRYLVTNSETNQMMSELVDLSKKGATKPPHRSV